MAQKRCCVRDCFAAREDNAILHSFPNPDTDGERFRTWCYAIGGDVLVLDSQFIHANRKVCHKHFDTKYQTRSSRLSANAIPTLQLKAAASSRKRPISDITNIISNNPTSGEPSTGPSPAVEPSSTKTRDYLTLAKASTSEKIDSTLPEKMSAPESMSQKPGTAKTSKVKYIANLKNTIKKLRNKKDSYATRLKKALKLSENTTFQKCLHKFTTLAALFTVMQFREISKEKMGRRFTKEEKIMALSLYKQGPKAYRWLSKIFILPSPVTLSRVVSGAIIRPGINKKIFAQLKKQAKSMKESEKLCMVLFDEISITPHFDHNRKRDVISGFVTNGTDTKRNIVDHALVFMLRGVIKNYKQPIAYTFCRGTTPKGELKMLLKNIITELQECGFKVVATVCDQGCTNVSTINSLIEETRVDYIKNDKALNKQIFEVNGEEVIPLFDPPHLIKGIRNNLLTKNLKCVIDNEEKIAKWDHIMNLHAENPAYKGIKLIKNLTEAHVDPKKIPKMKVKMATQIFSKTVATNMGYLADKGILPLECKDTADVLLFFDELFDSLNGSYENSRKRHGKVLLRAVTPKSEHSKLWAKAKRVLKTIKFVNKEGREGSVPSVTNWFRTIENIELLKNRLFKLNIKSIWMRHFNQDPLENFFGCIRSHGFRNISPTPHAFESAFTSLLINNLSSNHSIGANCEEDHCKVFKSMDCLLQKDDYIQETFNIDYEDIDCEIIDFNIKKTDNRIFSQLSYVTGYVLKKAKQKVIKNCEVCKEVLFSGHGNDYIQLREFSSTSWSLTYPSEAMIKIFSEIQDVASYILQNKSNLNNIKSYLKTLLYAKIDFSCCSCPAHKNELIEFCFELCSRFFIFNWCRDINKLLNGTSTLSDNTRDEIKKLACEYRKKIYKNRK